MYINSTKRKKRHRPFSCTFLRSVVDSSWSIFSIKSKKNENHISRIRKNKNKNKPCSGATDGVIMVVVTVRLLHRSSTCSSISRKKKRRKEKKIITTCLEPLPSICLPATSVVIIHRCIPPLNTQHGRKYIYKNKITYLRGRPRLSPDLLPLMLMPLVLLLLLQIC